MVVAIKTVGPTPSSSHGALRLTSGLTLARAPVPAPGLAPMRAGVHPRSCRESSRRLQRRQTQGATMSLHRRSSRAAGRRMMPSAS
jgi:hypothetical protein